MNVIWLIGIPFVSLLATFFGVVEGKIANLKLQNLEEIIKGNYLKVVPLIIINVLISLLVMFSLLVNSASTSEFVGVIIILFLLIYLISFDGLYFEIPALSTYVLCTLSFFYLLLESFFDISVFSANSTGEILFWQYLLSGFVYAGIYFFLWIVTNKQGMGDGDIYIAFFTGVLLGPIGTIIAFYATMIISLTFSLGLIIYKRQIKGVKIPFIPFMGYGFLIAMIIDQNWIFNLLF